MLFGDKRKFAINVNIEDISDGWVFGVYYFWVRGAVVGDEADHSVDLKGCWNWMRDFLSKDRGRCAPDLYEMDGRQVYLRLASSVLPGQNPTGFSREIYEDTFSRFHISHIGMSSFDRFTVLLIKNDEGMERLVWRDGDGDIQDAYLGANQLEEVFADVVKALEGTMLLASSGSSSI